MCLITTQKEAIILTKDLTVYKSFISYKDNTLYAIYQDFEYKRNVLYKTELTFSEESRIPCFDIEASLHLQKYLGWYEKPLKDNGLIAVLEGFHSAISYIRLISRSNVMECLIPAGSEVFYDETGLVVSNQIIVL